MRLPSKKRFPRLSALTFLAALGATALASPAGADAAALLVTVTGNGPAFHTTVDVSCESPAVRAAHGVDIAGAATATRHKVSVPAQRATTFTIDNLADGSACSITASASPNSLSAVDGGTALVGSDGQLRGVAVTVDRGTPVTAHLTYTIPVVLESTALHSEAAPTTTTAGSGGAASTPQLPASQGVASAAAPVELAAARSTTTMSSAALPDTSGSATTLVLASLGVLLCGIVGYGLALTSKRERSTH